MPRTTDDIPIPDHEDDPTLGIGGRRVDDDEPEDFHLVKLEMLRSTGRMMVALCATVSVFLGSRGWMIVPARDPAWPWHFVGAGILGGSFASVAVWVTLAYRRYFRVIAQDQLEQDRLRVLQRKQEIEDRELRELDDQFVNIQRAEREQRNFEAREKVRQRREKHQRQVEEAARKTVLDRQREIEADLTD